MTPFQAHLSSNDHHVSSQVPQPLDDHQSMKNGGGREVEVNDDDGREEEAFNSEMRELEDMFSKLNPMAEEFVPLSLAKNGGLFPNNTNTGRRKRSYNQGKRRMNARTSLAQREKVIRRTVYVSDIDHQITEEQLAALFLSCGQVVDCRVCGDPKSILRFAFIDQSSLTRVILMIASVSMLAVIVELYGFAEGAHAALSLSGTVVGYYPLRVLPSKTAIAPVNPTFLPRTEDEREMCARTIYCTNIDKKMSSSFLIQFVERFIV